MKDQIQKVIDEQINPILKLHNGGCQVVDFEDGNLVLRLIGGCVGCPSSKITMLNGVLPILKENFPTEITDVYLEQWNV